MITGNRGEWSEIYALFKLLGDEQLFLGDKDIQKLENLVYPIIRILRSEANGEMQYSIQGKIVLITGVDETIEIPISEFKSKSLFLLNAIKANMSGTFSVPEIEEFMKSINCLSLKANSSTKTDITIVVHDQRTNQQPTLGFSIKSQLGSASTLLNAGRTTNFKYKISCNNFSSSKIEEINSINSRSKIRDRVARILEDNLQLEFTETERQIFANNLILIDSKLPEILSEIVFEFYSTDKSNIVDLVSEVTIKNPLGFDDSNKHNFYEYKIKRFLTDVALGMMPSVVWTGQYDATGGYLIVKDNGDVLCYHIYNRNEFEDYLFSNTKLDTASSSRHQFGSVYSDGNDVFIKLNLQIRFTK